MLYIVCKKKSDQAKIGVVKESEIKSLIGESLKVEKT